MTYATRTTAFRFLVVAFAAGLTTAAIPASAMDRAPADQVPIWISASDFNSMSAAELYAVDRAQRLGKRVVIEGSTLAGSRDLVDEALNTGRSASRLSFSEQGPASFLDQHQGPGNR